MKQGVLAGSLLSLALLAAACGSSNEEGSEVASRPALPASEFPSPDGRSLLELVQQEASTEGPVVAPGGMVLRLGKNRLGFGVFTSGREQITDADLAIYAAPGGDGRGAAMGPFPTRVESLATEPAFRAKTTSDDPDAALVVYVAEVPLKRLGAWSFAALLKDGSSYSGSLIPTPSPVEENPPVPGPGDQAPQISTPTADDVADISEIDTRIPPDTMHEVDYADALGKQPIVLLFATPQLCQSRVCGPVVDVAEQVKREFGDEVTFIHMEVYVDNDPNKGLRPQLEAFGLPTEPWLFVIDRNGRVATVFEGAFGIDELTEAVQRVTD